MSTQPEALRLADALSAAIKQVDADDDVIHVARWFVEDADAELRRLHEENGRLRIVAEMSTLLLDQRSALLEALKEYGWHHEGCPQYPTYTHPDRWPACTCGFDDAIKAVEGEQA